MASIIAPCMYREGCSDTFETIWDLLFLYYVFLDIINMVRLAKVFKKTPHVNPSEELKINLSVSDVIIKHLHVQTKLTPYTLSVNTCSIVLIVPLEISCMHQKTNKC